MEYAAQKISQFLIPWFFSSGIKIIGVILAVYVIRKLSGTFIEKMVRKAVVSDRFLSKEAEKKREDTLMRIFEGAAGVLVWIVAVLIILSELGVDIAPLLGAAGIAGLAFGFGGQYLIKDVIAGLFIVLENQYRVGDNVCLDGTCGIVEDMNLRTTILRDSDGTTHYIHNGLVVKISNLSKK